MGMPMRAEPAVQLEATRARRSVRARAVASIAPGTILAGLLWGLIQPERLTFLHPRGEGFWWLAVEPPLLVILIGVLFGLVVVPGLIQDLEESED
jgi:hypothetical protein